MQLDRGLDSDTIQKVEITLCFLAIEYSILRALVPLMILAHWVSMFMAKLLTGTNTGCYLLEYVVLYISTINANGAR